MLSFSLLSARLLQFLPLVSFFVLCVSRRGVENRVERERVRETERGREASFCFWLWIESFVVDCEAQIMA